MGFATLYPSYARCFVRDQANPNNPIPSNQKTPGSGASTARQVKLAGVVVPDACA